MKDPRISIRLTEDEHYQLKMLALKRKKSVQKIMIEYIREEINKEGIERDEK